MARYSKQIDTYLKKIAVNNAGNVHFTHAHVIAIAKLIESIIPYEDEEIHFLIEGMKMDYVPHSYRSFFARELLTALEVKRTSKSRNQDNF